MSGTLTATQRLRGSPADQVPDATAADHPRAPLSLRGQITAAVFAPTAAAAVLLAHPRGVPEAPAAVAAAALVLIALFDTEQRVVPNRAGLEAGGSAHGGQPVATKRAAAAARERATTGTGVAAVSRTDIIGRLPGARDS
jgi:hypothetical protein